MSRRLGESNVFLLEDGKLPGGNGGGGDDMESRVANLEKDVAAISARLDATLPTLATKADLAEVRTEVQGVRVEVHSMANRLIIWSVSTIIAGGGLVFAILEFFGK